MNVELRPNRRRRLFIQPAYHVRFIAWVLATIVLFGLCFGGLLYLILDNALASATHSAHLQIEAVWKRLGWAIVLGSVVAVLVTGMAAALVVLAQSHLIVGPLYRIAKILEEVGRGNLEVNARLRAGDQLQELASVLQEMLERLRQRRTRRLKMIEEMGKLLEQTPSLELQAKLAELKQMEE